MSKKLFSNNNPNTTVHGLGYQDKKKAEYTIKNMLNRDMDYQFQVINTMYNRGLETIKRTKDKDKLKDLKEANVLFKKWLSDYKKKDKGKKKYKYLPLDVVNKMEVLAEYYNISRKARGLDKSAKSDKGFLQIYRKIKGDVKKLRNYPIRKNLPQGQTWDRHRNIYCKIRTNMVKKFPKYELYHESGPLKGLPTCIHVNMIMWAYSPDEKKIVKLAKNIKSIVKEIKKLNLNK